MGVLSDYALWEEQFDNLNEELLNKRARPMSDFKPAKGADWMTVNRDRKIHELTQEVERYDRGYPQALKHIEELEADLRDLTADLYDCHEQRIIWKMRAEKAEAKLAKAVDTLNLIVDDDGPWLAQDMVDLSRNTLKELKGQINE